MDNIHPTGVDALALVQTKINASLAERCKALGGSDWQSILTAGLAMLAQQVTDDVGVPVVVIPLPPNGFAAYPLPSVQKIRVVSALPTSPLKLIT